VRLRPRESASGPAGEVLKDWPNARDNDGKAREVL
jgi:hypothetical protein